MNFKFSQICKSRSPRIFFPHVNCKPLSCLYDHINVVIVDQDQTAYTCYASCSVLSILCANEIDQSKFKEFADEKVNVP